MGSGRWSTNVFDEHERLKSAAGIGAFDYSSRMHRGSRAGWKAHPGLDPLGVTIRESRDSAEHPDSTAVAVIFDVTGSMGEVPVILQRKLPELLGLLLRKGYASDPQILFGAVGDATCDRVPLQMGQFESDNRMDENLERIFLEGGGGGQQTESYELALYFMARHTEIDCWQQHGRKGYLFLIGDEMAYPAVKRAEVERHIGARLQQDIPLPGLVKDLRRYYHVFYLLPQAASYGGDPKILGFWRRLLGQNVLELPDSRAVCETIALAIGLTEGKIDLETGRLDLESCGVSPAAAASAAGALAHLPAPAAAPMTGGLLPGLVQRPQLPGGSPAGFKRF